MQLSTAQVNLFRDQGFLALPGFFSEEYVRRLLDRIEALCRQWQGDEARQLHMQQEPEVSAGAAEPSAVTIRKFAELARHDPLFLEHARHPNLLAVVSQLLGRPLSLYADQSLLKPPRHGSEKPEHQDNAYFRVEPADHVITCWMALDDADLENGCMHYYPGSHRQGLIAHRAIQGTPHLVPDGLRREDSVAAPVPAGGLILHHSETVHWSPANPSPRWRRAHVVHIVRSDAVLSARHPNSPALPVLLEA
ncbi:MAG: phytanoyl-CoA dioxygenase family protein [Armatimonadetes bacterium]|nr:phytanoyl-CoA dioxygenase family protein [Armatimonadota bacterium]